MNRNTKQRRINIIAELTVEQQSKFTEYHERYWRQATCTESADQLRAKVAAQKLAEIAGVEVQRVVWVHSPQEGAAEYSCRLGTLENSLGKSLRNSLWDSPGLACYAYTVEVLGMKTSSRNRELLVLWDELAASCFSLWIVPGMIILCERPATVKIEDGHLVGITWREKGLLARENKSSPKQA